MNQSLVNNQHVLPAKSIERFCSPNGEVQVRRLNSENIFPAKPKNNIFCVKRVWDQRSEQGYGKNIEDKFQSLIEYVLNKKLNHLPSEGHKIASEFYTLWCLRSKIESYDELSEGNLVGVTGSKLTTEQKRNLEIPGTVYLTNFQYLIK